MRRGVLATVLAVGMLLATGCTGARGELLESGVEPGSTEVELLFADDDGDGAETDADLFGFTAPDLTSGYPVVGAELYENAPTIVTFVVPSCPVCVTEAPKLSAAAEAHPEVNFLFVHSFGEVSEFVEYADGYELSHENTVHVVDIDGILWERFGLVSQPSTVLVDHTGAVSSSVGALGDDGLLRAISTVTGEEMADMTSTADGAGHSGGPDGDAETEADADAVAVADEGDGAAADVDG